MNEKKNVKKHTKDKQHDEELDDPEFATANTP